MGAGPSLQKKQPSILVNALATVVSVSHAYVAAVIILTGGFENRTMYKYLFPQVDGDDREYSEDGCMKDPSGLPMAVSVPESGLKISHTSPDIPLETQAKVDHGQAHTLARDRVQRQITEPTSSVRSVDIISSVLL